MSALTRSAIRRRIAEACSGQGQAGWRESRYHPDHLGRDPRSVAHLSFAVDIGTTTVAAHRQRLSTGAVAETSVTVRWLHRLRADAQIGDYDDALDAGEALTAAVLAVEPSPGLRARLLRAGPLTTVGDGTHIRQDLEFAVLHLLALAEDT